MKKIIVITFLIIISINGIGQTQSEMNYEQNKSYSNADDELNAVYKAILKEYSTDTVFIEALRTSQRIWIKFRDSELEMKFPDRGNSDYYGSVYPMCESSYLERLTKKRVKTLKIWLEGIEEGDVCSGSVKMAR